MAAAAVADEKMLPVFSSVNKRGRDATASEEAAFIGHYADSGDGSGVKAMGPQSLLFWQRVRHTSHIAHHTSHVTRHTSHITHHTSHVTRHSSQGLCLNCFVRNAMSVGGEVEGGGVARHLQVTSNVNNRPQPVISNSCIHM